MALLKVGLCPDCPEVAGEQALIGGVCPIHYWRQKRAEANNRYLAKKRVELPNLPLWYIYQINHSAWVCENCSQPIDPFSRSAQYGAQAHILPKHLFFSIATHPLNHLHLGHGWGCDCHSIYDSSWERAAQLPVIALAQLRFMEFAHCIAEKELRHLPLIFQETYNKL